MDNSDDQSLYNNRNNKLGKDEVLRGHNAYSSVLQSSVSISTDFLKAFINKQDLESDSIDFTKSPLFTNNVKVGFIIAKKKIKKAVLRNRIKRLLRESYRLDKTFFITLPFNLNIIFTLTETGYGYFITHPKTKLEFINEEMKKLQLKIKNNFNL